MSLIVASILLKIKQYLLRKGRLIVEYGMIVTVVILGALSINLFFQSREADNKLQTLEGKLSDQSVMLFTLTDSNARQQNTINNLMELRSRDATAIEGLITDYKALADTSTKADKRLKKLEDSNEAVRVYLSSDIPAPLMCLLNNTCTPSNNSEDGVHQGAST